MADFSGHILSFTSLVVLAQVRGEEIFSYQRVGDSVTLKCANVLQGHLDCSSTTWLHSRDSRGTIKLFVKGKKETLTLTGPKASRLSLRPDCSLNISVIDVEDAGIYVCQQSYSNGEVLDRGENMYLSVLSGTVQNDTFMCSVASFNGRCRGLSLSWSSQGRSNTSQPESAGPCVTTLRRSDTLDSEALQCLLKTGSSLKGSFTFPPRTKVTGPGGSEIPTRFVYLDVALRMGVLLLIVVVGVLLVVAYAKRAQASNRAPQSV